MLLESLPPRAETPIQPEAEEIDSSLQTQIYYGLYAAAYRRRVVFPKSFENSSGFLNHTSLTKSHLASSPPLNLTGYEDINTVIQHVKKSVPHAKTERETHFMQLGTHLIGVGKSDDEGRLSRRDFDTAIQILAKLDTELEGGVNYLFPLASRLAQFTEDLSYEAEKVARDKQGTENIVSTDRKISSDGLNITTRVLTEKGMHPEIAKAIFNDSESFGIQDYFSTSSLQEIHNYWLRFRPSHLRALKPITDEIVETLAQGSVPYIETANLRLKHRLDDFLTVKSISGESIAEFLPGIKDDYSNISFLRGDTDLLSRATVLTVDIPGENYTANDKNLPSEFSPMVLWLQQTDQFGNTIPYTPIVKLVRYDRYNKQFIVNYAGQRFEVDTKKPKTDQDWHHIFSFSQDPDTGYAQASIPVNRMRRVGLPLGICDHSSQQWQSANTWTEVRQTDQVQIPQAYYALTQRVA